MFSGDSRWPQAIHQTGTTARCGWIGGFVTSSCDRTRRCSKICATWMKASTAESEAVSRDRPLLHAAQMKRCPVRIWIVTTHECIRAHLNYFNKHRKGATDAALFPASFALIIAELFLDRRTNHEAALRKELILVAQRTAGADGEIFKTEFPGCKRILTKLAFLLATKEAARPFCCTSITGNSSTTTRSRWTTVRIATGRGAVATAFGEHGGRRALPVRAFSLEDSGFEAVGKDTVRVIPKILQSWWGRSAVRA